MNKPSLARAIALCCAVAAGQVSIAHAAPPTKTNGPAVENRGRAARCATGDIPAAQKAQVDKALSKMSAAKGHAVVPVYFHVITTSTGGANVSALVPEQIRVLNEAFASAGFTFDLREVTVTANDAWFFSAAGSVEEQEMKRTLRRGGPESLNIYTTNGDVYLGWATFPHDAKKFLFYDGVVVWWASLPGSLAEFSDPDGIEPDGFFTYNLGDTATHEVGHWLGLYHTFEGGCSSPGDFANDTPAEAYPQFYCLQRDTCIGPNAHEWGLDPVTNFMDYVDDACMDHFTPNQEKRMRQSWIAYRR